MKSIHEGSEDDQQNSDQEMGRRLTSNLNSSSIKKAAQRSVSKRGFCAILKRRRVANLNYYTKDLFTSLVDSRWRWILFMFTISFLGSWIVFAVLWWVIAYAHGDLKISPYKNADREPCITFVDDMLSSFLFSLETQYSTGYGTRSPTVECPEAIFVLCIQSLFGLLLQCVMLGVVFAKLSTPKGRSQTIWFSEKAVICLRDGSLHLMFRIADVRRTHLIECKVRAWILQSRISPEGEMLANYQRKLKVSVDEGGSEMFLLWPVTVVHRIDEQSPLYELSASQLFTSDFEIVVALICTAETTGQTTEARTSYLPTEIHWGRRFLPVVKQMISMELDYSEFEKTTLIETPSCSGSELSHVTGGGGAKFKRCPIILGNSNLNDVIQEK